MAITASEQRAISKAMNLDLAAQVERVRFGLYRVPSTSEEGVTWTVAIESGTYSCTCKAANKPACMHRAAVYLAKLQATGAKVVGVKPAIRTARQGKPTAAPAPVVCEESEVSAISTRPGALATFRVNGQTFTGSGRNVLDALGNAQAA